MSRVKEKNAITRAIRNAIADDPTLTGITVSTELREGKVWINLDGAPFDCTNPGALELTDYGFSYAFSMGESTDTPAARAVLAKLKAIAFNAAPDIRTVAHVSHEAMKQQVARMRAAPPPLFKPGQIVSTPGALDAFGNDMSKLMPLLTRHLAGDWGAVCAEDKTANNEAVKDGSRILSAYPIDPAQPCAGYGANCLWIITEADRSATTFLLPDEY